VKLCPTHFSRGNKGYRPDYNCLLLIIIPSAKKEKAKRVWLTKCSQGETEHYLDLSIRKEAKMYSALDCKPHEMMKKRTL